MVILSMFFAFIALLIFGILSFNEKDLIWSGFQIIMALATYVSIMHIKSEYPKPWNFKPNENFINGLNEYRETNEK